MTYTDINGNQVTTRVLTVPIRGPFHTVHLKNNILQAQTKKALAAAKQSRLEAEARRALAAKRAAAAKRQELEDGLEHVVTRNLLGNRTFDRTADETEPEIVHGVHRDSTGSLRSV